MKHKILSMNTFTLVSKIHCVCFSSIKNCVRREMIPCKIELKRYREKNSKIPKRILIKPCSKTRSDKSTCANILTLLFRHCLGMNATSCYWSYIDFYTLITYNYILTDTSNSDTEFISWPLTCLKNFENFTGTHLCRSLFFTKLQAFRPKKDSYTGVFL